MTKSGELNLNKVDESLKKDPIFNLKYIAFCNAVKPSFDESLPLEEFGEFAKCQLSLNYKIPLKDPIWDKYTTEELIVEFFSLRFHKDVEYAKEFESKLSGEYQADFDWMEQQIQKNKEAVNEYLKQEEEFPKEIKFSPKG